MALGVGMVVLVWAGTLLHISMEYEQTGRSAQRELGNLATLFEEQLSRVLGGVDQTLRHLRSSYLEDPDRFDLVSWSARVQAISDFSFQTVIIGPDGYMVSSSISGPSRVDLRDREHFRVHAERKVEGLFVSKPIIGRVSGRASIQLTRRIDNADGSFGGVAVMSIDPEYLARFYGSIDLGSRGAIMLVGTDGVLRVRKTAEGVKSGLSLADAVLFRALKRNTRAGVYVVTDHMSRHDLLFNSWKDKAKILVVNNSDAIDSGKIVAYRKVEGMPLIVTVASGLDDVFAGDYREQAIKVSLASLLSILILTVTLLIVRYQRGLAIARDAAEAGTRARSTFLAAMSHEIRTPMNAVLGLASSLIETPLNDEQRRSVSAINESGTHLLRILNDILDFSKMEAGQVQLERAPFSPEMVTANVLSVIGPRAKAKGLTVDLDCAPDLPVAVSGDASRVSQVLMNLMSNAVKFTERGSVTIKVECLSRVNGSAMLQWRVIDTGPGIPADRLNKLFGEFMQVDNSIARRFGGSGLGLAICKRLVGLMGGEVGVVSREGEGSDFWMRLTLPEAAALETAKQDSESKHTDDLTAAIKALGRPAHVLLAEDNATNQLVVGKMLESFDVILTLAADGMEAVEAVSKFSFDVVLMDMCMPNMDGLQAAAAIRARGGSCARIPIMALTANVFPEDITACRNAGMDGFLAKPIRKRELAEAMARALSGSAAAIPVFPAADVGTEDAGATAETLAEMQAEIGLDGLAATLVVFLRETDARLRRLEVLSCDKDRATIKGEAHTLKGASATLGLTRLSTVARELEAAAADIQPDNYAAIVERLKTLFAGGRAYLEQRLRTATEALQQGAAVPSAATAMRTAPAAATQAGRAAPRVPADEPARVPRVRAAAAARKAAARKPAARKPAAARRRKPQWEAKERARLKERLRLWKERGRPDYQGRLIELCAVRDEEKLPSYLRERLEWQFTRPRRDLRDPETGEARSILDLIAAGDYDPLNPRHRLSLNTYQKGNPAHLPPPGSDAQRGRWVLGPAELPNAGSEPDGHVYEQAWPLRQAARSAGGRARRSEDPHPAPAWESEPVPVGIRMSA